MGRWGKVGEIGTVKIAAPGGGGETAYRKLMIPHPSGLPPFLCSFGLGFISAL